MLKGHLPRVIHHPVYFSIRRLGVSDNAASSGVVLSRSRRGSLGDDAARNPVEYVKTDHVGRMTWIPVFAFSGLLLEDSAAPHRPGRRYASWGLLAQRERERRRLQQPMPTPPKPAPCSAFWLFFLFVDQIETGSLPIPWGAHSIAIVWQEELAQAPSSI